jgi:RNA polymerase sigma factor (TIGR02999 family)
MSSQGTVTQLLISAQRGDKAALDRLLPVVYAELRRLAAAYLRRERSNHTLQATALVHEAYLRLVDQREVDWQNRAQFFGLAAEMMRRILVNYAQQTHAQKRGGYQTRLALDDAISLFEDAGVDLIALDEALMRLAALDPRQSRIVELRFFGGLSVEETAEVIGVSAITVKREWRIAKAWLFDQLKSPDQLILQTNG